MLIDSRSMQWRFLWAILAVVFLVFVSLAIYPHEADQQQKCPQGTTAEECRQDATNAKMAFYTKWMAIFAAVSALAVIGQVIIAGRQTRILDEQGRLTKDAVNIAGRSATAATAIERAYVYPIIESSGAILDCIRAAQAFYPDTADPFDENRPCGVTTNLGFSIRNYGKTPAILKEAYVGFGIHPVGAQIGVVIPEPILGAGQSTSVISSDMQRGFSKNEALHVVAYTKSVVFVGQILFEDIWGVVYQTEFIFDWEPASQKMQLTGISTKRMPEEKK